MQDVVKRSNIPQKSYGVHVAKFLKYVWPTLSMKELN